MASKRDEINRMARLLIAEWERVDEPVNASRVANFADMARAVVAELAEVRAERDEARARLAAVETLAASTRLTRWRTEAAVGYVEPVYANNRVLGLIDELRVALAASSTPAEPDAGEARWFVAETDLTRHDAEVTYSDRCGATEWAYCNEGRPHVYRVCTLPRGHEGRWHREDRDGKLWAESSGDDGPAPRPWCSHTETARLRSEAGQ